MARILLVLAGVFVFDTVALAHVEMSDDISRKLAMMIAATLGGMTGAVTFACGGLFAERQLKNEQGHK